MNYKELDVNCIDFAWKYYYENMFLGCDLDFHIVVKNDMAFFNGKIYNSKDMVELLYTSVIHKAITCKCFQNGSWLKRVMYSDLESIRKQDENDYYIDTTLMNLLFSIKVIVNECLINSNDIYYIYYSNEVGDYSIFKNEDLIVIIDEMKEYVEER